MGIDLDLRGLISKGYLIMLYHTFVYFIMLSPLDVEGTKYESMST
jgi:hypothetical protein